MKFLVLFLVCFNLYAVERKEIRKAKKEIAEVNKARTFQSPMCNLYSNATDKATCNASFESHMKSGVEGTVGNAISDYKNKAHEELISELKEEKCITQSQSQLDELSLPYNGSETCDQLKVALQIYYDSLQGSGSGE